MRTVAVHRVRPCSSSPGSTWAAPAGWFERLSGSPGEPDPDGRSLATVVARDGQGPSPATTPAIGSDPYEMTGPLLAWGAAREAQPDAVLKPGAHGVVAALGLEALSPWPPRQEYTKSTGPRSAVDDGGTGIDHGAGALKRTCGELLPRWCTMWSPHSSPTGSPAVGGGGCRRCRVDDQVVRSGVSRPLAGSRPPQRKGSRPWTSRVSTSTSSYSARAPADT